MAAETIDLSTIPPIYSKKLVKFKPVPKNDMLLRKKKYALFKQRKRISDRQFHDMLTTFNAKLIQDIDNFIRESIAFGDFIFPCLSSQTIHLVTLTLGLHASDHDPILSMISKYILKTFKDTTIWRIEANTAKKDIIDSKTFHSDQKDAPPFRNLVVIVEETQVMGLQILNVLMNKLYHIKDSFRDMKVIAIFCMSGNWNTLNRMLPVTSLNRAKIYKTIVNDTKIIARELLKKIMLNDISTLQLGPNLTNLIYYHFLERDPSIMNLKYLNQFAILDQTMNQSSLLNLPHKELIDLIKSSDGYIEVIRDLESVKAMRKELQVDWKNPQAVADFCISQVDEINRYFNFIWRELRSYFHIIRDETDEGFPADPLELYEELFRYDDLGQSVPVIDAISKIQKFPPDRLLIRLKSAIDDFDSVPKGSKYESIQSKLIVYRDRFDNNHDCKRTFLTNTTQLIDNLRKHAGCLKNPKRLPLIEAVYYDDIKILRARTIPAQRVEAQESLCDNSSYYGLLYGIIRTCPEENQILDLFNDFKQAIETNGKFFKESSYSGQDYDSLMKSIFLDLILCMEQQGLIIRDNRKSKAGCIRRRIWL